MSNPQPPTKRSPFLFSILILSIVAIVLLPSVSSTATLQTTQPCKIAFDSNRDGNREIYVMNADGTNQTQLTFNNSFAHNLGRESFWPSFSGDGSRIAFTTDHDGNYEIYVINADGTGLTDLTNNPADDYAPSFSPDGSHIAFQSTRDGLTDIYIMDADGTNQTRLTSYAGDNEFPSFNGNGSRIAFTSTRDGNQEIYVMNADGTSQTRLTHTTANNFYPSFSRDGSRIAFTSDRDGNQEIYVMNADGTGQTRLTNNPADDHNPSFSPDGSKIAFTTNRDGNDEIYVMNADGTGQTNLTNDPLALDQLPSWGGCQFFGPPTNKEQCKKDGWQKFTVPRKFKNQGDCIQFVNTGK
jgi:Tol biopolymer transport system component